MYIHRLKIIIPLLFLTLLLAACGSSGGAPAKATPKPSPTPDQGLQLLAKAGQKLYGAKTLHALLDISVSGSGFNGTINAEVWNEQTNKVRLVVLQSTLAQVPAGEITVSNGQQIWLYDPSKKVAYTAKLNGTGTTSSPTQDTSQFLLNLVHSIFSAKPASTTTTSTTLKGHAVYDVHIMQSVRIQDNGATPTAGGTSGTPISYIADIYLDKSTNLPVEIAFSVQGFAQATLDFPTLQLNQPVDESLFTFTPPAGVKVEPFPQGGGSGSGSLTLAQAQQEAGYHLLSIPASQPAYTLKSIDALGAPGNQVFTLNYLLNGSTPFTIAQGKALANLPSSGQSVKVRGTTGFTTTVGSGAMLAWTENGVGIQIAGPLSSAQLTTIAGLLA